MRAGGEVLQARADGQHQIGVYRHGIGGGRTGDAYRAQVERVVPGQAAFAGLRLGDRNTVLLRKAAQRGPSLAVQDTAPCNDQRAFGTAQQGGSSGQLRSLGRRAAEADQPGVQKIFRAVKGLGLYILRQRQTHRAAQRRVGHDLDRAGQGAQDLTRVGDAVKVAGHRAEGVVGAQVAVVEVFHLLQHRIGRARLEHITRQQQHRQAVHMRHRCRRHHICRTRPDGGGDRHDALAELCFAVGNRGVRHALFVVGAVGG